MRIRRWFKPTPRVNEFPLGALAVPEDEPWWIAVNRLIDQAEWETIEGARERTRDTNACIAAVGASEGVALVRDKLKQARDLALDELKTRQLGAWG